MMKKTFLVLSFIVASLSIANLFAQDAGYQMPPKVMADLLLATPTPTVSISGKGNWLLICGRNNYTTVEELGQPEVRVAGLRINPNNFSLSRQAYYNNMVLKNTRTGKQYELIGLPTPLAATDIVWNGGEKKVAFINRTESRADLYIIDMATQKVTMVNKQPLNTVLGNAFAWFDDNTLLYKTIVAPASAAPRKPVKPSGPSIQESDGKVAPSATFEDLIQTPYDERLFDFYATSNLSINKDGVETTIGNKAIYGSFSLSPDKKYLLSRKVHKPFSYLVTASGFPSTISVSDLKGNVVRVLHDLPSEEGTPSGYDNVQDVPRAYEWRADEPATVVWAKPLDSGLVKKKSSFRGCHL